MPSWGVGVPCGAGRHHEAGFATFHWYVAASSYCDFLPRCCLFLTGSGMHGGGRWGFDVPAHAVTNGTSPCAWMADDGSGWGM
jgi:hypothetical protein